MRRYAVPLSLLLALTACAQENPGNKSRDPDASANRPASSGSPSSTGSPNGSTPPDTELPPGGTAAEPAIAPPHTSLLGWEEVPGPTDDTVTTSGKWSLRVNQAGTSSSLEGPHSGSGSGSSGGTRISDALIDGQYAVVVRQDKKEEQPSVAEVTDLASGEEFTLDGSSDLPTTTGGTWALGQGHLLHATVAKGAYCVASVDLATHTSTLGWCAPKRHGFNGARITPAGDSLMTFDDSQPSCRTVVALEGSQVEPFPGVEDCKGWDGLLLDDGSVWSVIPKENNVEAARFYARSGEGYYDLGPGTSGSLTWCGDAAYFVRDPQRDGDPARLMRWRSDDGLSVVYESPGGQAFLAEPRCGGDTITVTALAEGGDEQVSAPVR